MEELDTVLSHTTSKWSGTVILTGETNIDLFRTGPVSQRYTELLSCYGMKNHITTPTRSGKKIIDHIVSNIDSIVTEGVIPSDKISDHDLLYIITKIKKPRLNQYHKYIRNEKTPEYERLRRGRIKITIYNSFAFDDPEEQVIIFNSL